MLIQCPRLRYWTSPDPPVLWKWVRGRSALCKLLNLDSIDSVEAKINPQTSQLHQLDVDQWCYMPRLRRSCEETVICMALHSSLQMTRKLSGNTRINTLQTFLTVYYTVVQSPPSTVWMNKYTFWVKKYTTAVCTASLAWVLCSKEKHPPPSADCDCCLSYGHCTMFTRILTEMLCPTLPVGWHSRTKVNYSGRFLGVVHGKELPIFRDQRSLPDHKRIHGKL